MKDRSNNLGANSRKASGREKRTTTIRTARFDSGNTAQVEVAFRLAAPSAGAVAFAADFTDWDKAPIQMTKAGSGVWQVKVPLAPGTHRYKFLVDGKWQDDPACPQRIPNPFGSADALIEVR